MAHSSRTPKKKKSALSTASAPQSATLAWMPWLLLAAAILFVTAIRWRLLDVPMERDEGEYAYMGQLILDGVPPYKEAYNMKLPGTYAAYAAIMAVFGQSIQAIHMGLILASLISMVLLFLYARDVVGLRGAAAAPWVYGLLALSEDSLGTAAHATHFVALFAIPGAWLLWRARTNARARESFASGVFFGLALLMKQQGALIAAFGFVWIAWTGLRKPVRNWTDLLRKQCFLGAGLVLPYALTCLILWRAGVFEQFWFWTVSYARAYVSEVTPMQAGALFLGSMRRLVTEGPLWAVAMAGLAAALWRRKSETEYYLAGLFLFSFLAVCPGFFFRSHYYIVLFPALALLAAYFVQHPPRWLPRPLAALSLIASVVVFLVQERAYLFELSPLSVSRALYVNSPFAEAAVAASYLAENTRPDDRIAVLGSEPEIYFLAHRRSATGHIYVYGLMENQPYALRMQEEMIREIESARPGYLVSVNNRWSWGFQPGSSRRILDWSRTYTQAHYEPVKVIPIVSEDELAMGLEWARSQQTTRDHIVIFRRKSPPV